MHAVRSTAARVTLCAFACARSRRCAALYAVERAERAPNVDRLFKSQESQHPKEFLNPTFDQS